jgi:hypothetical protein
VAEAGGLRFRESGPVVGLLKTDECVEWVEGGGGNGCD